MFISNICWMSSKSLLATIPALFPPLFLWLSQNAVAPHWSLAPSAINPTARSVSRDARAVMMRIRQRRSIFQRMKAKAMNHRISRWCDES